MEMFVTQSRRSKQQFNLHAFPCLEYDQRCWCTTLTSFTQYIFF